MSFLVPQSSSATNRSFLVVSLLLTLGLALTAAPVQAQTCSFSGTLDTDPETLVASEPVKGKYYEMIDAQLTSPYAGKGGMTTGQIVALAEEIGIDPEWMRERLNSSAKRAAVNRLSYEARQAGIESTPTLAIGKKIISNRSAACIGQMIELELSTAESSSEKSDR